MLNIFEWLYVLVEQITQAFGYPGIFLLMVLENIFPPIPSEMIMPMAGFMVARGDLHPAGVWLAGTLGSLVGAIGLYLIAVRFGQRRLRDWICRRGRMFLLNGRDLDRSLDAFGRYGRSAVFLGRLIPGVRSLISIPAGLRQMPWPLFLSLTVAGATVWNLLLMGAGYILGSRWEMVLGVLDAYETVLLVAVAALAGVFLYHRLTAPPEERGC